MGNSFSKENGNFITRIKENGFWVVFFFPLTTELKKNLSQICFYGQIILDIQGIAHSMIILYLPHKSNFNFKYFSI